MLKIYRVSQENLTDEITFVLIKIKIFFLCIIYSHLRYTYNVRKIIFNFNTENKNLKFDLNCLGKI